jgi:CBS domain-containing protein
MTRDVAAIDSEASVLQAATLMKERDVGALLVMAGKNPIGVVTDRDITIRSVSIGQNPTTTKVGQIASENLVWCRSDYTIENASKMMISNKIRRLLVVDENYQPVGIISLSDLAKSVRDLDLAGNILAQICNKT